MTGLPPAWAETRIPLIADILDSQRVPVNKAERATRPGPVPYYGATGHVGWIDRPLFNEELCLLGEDGAPFLDRYKQKAYVIDGPSWVNNHAHVLRAIASATYNRFLKHVLDWTDYGPYVNGTTRLKLTKGALSTIPIPLPPLNEQLRIVAAIEEQFSRLDTADELLRRAISRLAALRKAVFSEAVSVGDSRSVRDLLQRIEAGRSFKCHGRRADNDEWGVIKVSAMTWGSFDERENKAVLSAATADSRWEIKAGDLLLSRANTTEYVGASVLVRRSRPRLLLSDKSMRLITRDDVVNKAWLQLALSAPESRAQMSAMATGTSDSMRNISQEKVMSISLKVPPLSEQGRIVAEVDRQLSLVDALHPTIEAASCRSAALRHSILEQAFRGELVPHDPSDEPASALLDRVAGDHLAVMARRWQEMTA